VTRPREVTPCCRNCRKPRQRKANGRLDGAKDLCRCCYSRWDRAGKPGDMTVPAPLPQEARIARSAAAQRAERDARIAEFTRLLRAGFTSRQSARRIGISDTTRREYERALDRQGTLSNVA
jgi:hypothetical protein